MIETTGAHAATPTGQRPLPDGWRWARLGDVATLIAGQSPPGETYRHEPDGLPFFQGKADFGMVHPVARVWCVSPIKIAEPGDVLISVRAPVGPTNIADARCCIGRGIAAIRVDALADRDYIHYALQLGKTTLEQLGSGSTFAAISMEDLRTFMLPLPPLPEQRRIAAALRARLAAVERMRAATDAQLAAAQALPAAALRAVFESDEAQAWPRVRLGDVCDGPGQYGTSVKATAEPIGVPILRMGNIHDGQILLDDLKYVSLPESELSKYLLTPGDVVFNRTNSAELVGKTAVFDGYQRPVVFASYLIRFRVRTDKADSRYLSSYINSALGRAYIEANMTRAIGQVNISASTMSNMPVPLPDLPRQRQIAATLRDRTAEAERVSTTLQAQLEAIAALPQALLRQAFEGEL